jgi:replicative DNA helicase
MERNKLYQPSEFGKIPPQAVELEAAILGSIIVEGSHVLPTVQEILRIESFYNEKHGKVFKAITELASENNPIDCGFTAKEKQ